MPDLQWSFAEKHTATTAFAVSTFTTSSCETNVRNSFKKRAATEELGSGESPAQVNKAGSTTVSGLSQINATGQEADKRTCAPRLLML